MHRRDRLERAISGESVDRVPVSLWRHFPGDDQRAADLARSIINFQKQHDWDFARVMPSNNFQVIDYGIQDVWLGDAQGKRETSKHVIQRSLDWTELRALGADRGTLAQQLECLTTVCKALGSLGVPIVQTIYSPFLQAAQIAGPSQLLQDMRTQPDRLRSGLNTLTETTLRLMEAMRTIPDLSGIFLVTRYASHDLVSEEEYQSHAMPLNENIMDAIERHWWLNLVQIQGSSPMRKMFASAPVQVINWKPRGGANELALAKAEFPGAISGTLLDWEHLHQSTPALLQSAIRDAINQTEGRRFILTGSGDGFITAPWSNLRAVRNIVESLAI